MATDLHEVSAETAPEALAWDEAPGDEALYEIVDGERREIEPMGAVEAMLATLLADAINAFARPRQLGLAAAEMLFVLDVQRGLQRRPDVAFVAYRRWAQTFIPRASAWNVIPNFAVEFVSPTNLAEEIDGKRTEYFAAGVELVWLVYPDSRRIDVHTSPTDVRGFDANDELDGGQVLPDFRIRMQDLFDALVRPEPGPA